ITKRRSLRTLPALIAAANPNPKIPSPTSMSLAANSCRRAPFETGWSLILRACERCNNQKSDLEDEISAITMLPDLGTRHTEPDLSALSARKAAGARSRLTRKYVADSYEEHVVEGRLMSAIDCRFAFTAPPRVAPERIMRLARFHLQG